MLVETVVVTTTGDRRAATPIHAMGGKGVFVKEVQAAVLDGRADIAVHSSKDLPPETPPGLVLAAIPERGDPRDALVGCRLAELPTGALVATGSVRRRAQLAWLRPDLTFAELRGNIATRLKRVADYHAIVMAAVALERLRINPETLDTLDPDTMVPQAGQGAIAVECRADDHATLALLATIEHAPTRRAVDAERAFLAELDGDCDLPVAAHAICGYQPPDDLELTGLLASPDGQAMLKETRRGSDPAALGRTVARYLLNSANGRRLIAEQPPLLP